MEAQEVQPANAGRKACAGRTLHGAWNDSKHPIPAALQVRRLGMPIASQLDTMPHDIRGIWYNQHGSRLALVVSNGSLTGTFASSVGLSKAGEEASVVGFVVGNLVSFVANFAPHASITAWAGHVTGEEEQQVMELQWQMTVALPGREDPRDLWRGIWMGFDVFRRQPSAPSGASRSIASHPVPDWP